MLHAKFQTNLDYIPKPHLQIKRAKQVDLSALETALVYRVSHRTPTGV